MDANTGLHAELGRGGSIIDGRYDLARAIAWASGCGGLASYPLQATLEIHGRRMEMVWSGPVGFNGGMITQRSSYTFEVAGSELRVRTSCPPDDSSFAETTIKYTAGDAKLHLESFPPSTVFEALFERRQD